jgi:hypothetical protein
VWRKGRGELLGFEDLEVIRAQAGLSVVGFCDLLGMPRASWYRGRAAVTGGGARPGTGPWPAPAVDQIVGRSAYPSACSIGWTKSLPAWKSQACRRVLWPAASSRQAIHSAQARSAPV